MNKYITYRNGSQTLTQRITNALAHFNQTIGAAPVAVVVNPCDLAEAGAIVTALDLPALQVIGNGGVSLMEVWLQNPLTTNLSKSAAKLPDSPLSAQPGASGGN